MTTAKDIVDSLSGLHSAKATTIARAQTGVEPGYDGHTGYALTEDGRIRGRGARMGVLVYADSVQTVTHDTDTNIDFDLSNAAAYDHGGFYSAGSPSRLTVPASGYYRAWGHAVWNASSTGYRSVTLKQFDAANALVRFISQSNVAGVPTVTTIHDAQHAGIYLNATDYVTFVVRQTSGADRDIQLSSAFALIRVG